LNRLPLSKTASMHRLGGGGFHGNFVARYCRRHSPNGVSRTLAYVAVRSRSLGKEPDGPHLLELLTGSEEGTTDALLLSHAQLYDVCLDVSAVTKYGGPSPVFFPSTLCPPSPDVTKPVRRIDRRSPHCARTAPTLLPCLRHRLAGGSPAGANAQVTTARAYVPLELF
jgi:hypothetical protein